MVSVCSFGIPFSQDEIELIIFFLAIFVWKYLENLTTMTTQVANSELCTTSATYMKVPFDIQ